MPTTYENLLTEYTKSLTAIKNSKEIIRENRSVIYNTTVKGELEDYTLKGRVKAGIAYTGVGAGFLAAAGVALPFIIPIAMPWIIPAAVAVGLGFATGLTSVILSIARFVGIGKDKKNKFSRQVEKMKRNQEKIKTERKKIKEFLKKFKKEAKAAGVSRKDRAKMIKEAKLPAENSVVSFFKKGRKKGNQEAITEAKRTLPLEQLMAIHKAGKAKGVLPEGFPATEEIVREGKTYKKFFFNNEFDADGSVIADIYEVGEKGMLTPVQRQFGFTKFVKDEFEASRGAWVEYEQDKDGATKAVDYQALKAATSSIGAALTGETAATVISELAETEATSGRSAETIIKGASKRRYEFEPVIINGKLIGYETADGMVYGEKGNVLGKIEEGVFYENPETVYDARSTITEPIRFKRETETFVLAEGTPVYIGKEMVGYEREEGNVYDDAGAYVGKVLKNGNLVKTRRFNAEDYTVAEDKKEETLIGGKKHIRVPVYMGGKKIGFSNTANASLTKENGAEIGRFLEGGVLEMRVGAGKVAYAPVLTEDTTDTKDLSKK